MDYIEFKEYINNQDLDSKEIYQSLIKKYDKETIDIFYNNYIKDETVKDENKYEKVDYYLELKDKNYELKSMYNENAFVQYLNYIYEIKKMNKEEINELFIKYSELSNIINFKNIKDKDIYIKLKEFGFKNITYDKDKNLKEGLEYLNNLSVKNKKVLELISNINLMIEINQIYKKLIEQNLRLVIKVAKILFIKKLGSQYGSMNIMDIIQEGNIGLGTAITKYDISKGYCFSTFAFHWIKQGIIRSIENQSQTIRKPANFNTIIRRINRERRFLYDELGRYPKDEELAKKLGMPVKQLLFMIQSNEAITSLDKTINDDEDTSIKDMIEDTKNIEDHIINEDNIEDIRRLFKISNISNKQKLIIILRNGLDIKLYMNKKEVRDVLKYNDKEFEHIYNSILIKQEELTLDKISKLFNMTREGVRILEAGGIKKLALANKTYEERTKNMLNTTNSNIKTLKYYDALARNNKLSDQEINKLINEARELLKSLNLNGTTKVNIKRSLIFVYCYNEDFEFSTESIDRAIKFLDSIDRGRNTKIRLLHYREYVEKIEKLMKHYVKLSIEIIRSEIAKRYLFEYDNIDMSSIMKEINKELRVAIERFMNSNESDLEKFLTPCIVRTVGEQIRNKERKNKTKVKKA